MYTTTHKVITGFVVAFIAIFVVGLFSYFVWPGSWSSNNSSYAACIFNGGPVDNKNFRGYEPPGAGRHYQGLFSEVVDVPVGIRQYRVALDPSQGDTPQADSIKVRVKGYELQFEPTVNFTLRTDIKDGKPVVCEFIEKHLRQFGATDFDKQGGNWQFKFLNERFRPILNNVAIRVLQTYDPGALKFNTDGARDKAAAEIGSALNDAWVSAMGGDYFCDTDYTFNAGHEVCGNVIPIILPEPILSADDEAQLAKPERAKIDANNDIAVAQEQGRKASEVAAAKELEADSATRLADANETIAAQNERVETAQAKLDYAWCAYLVDLNQRCDLVLAAKNENYPQVIGAEPTIAVPIPTTTP